jgi:hypothetical protein
MKPPPRKIRDSDIGKILLIKIPDRKYPCYKWIIGKTKYGLYTCVSSRLKLFLRNKDHYYINKYFGMLKILPRLTLVVI